MEPDGRQSRRRGHPPTRTRDLPELTREPLTFLERCAREYGDAVPLRFGPVRLVFLNHPAFVEEVLVTQQRAFVKGSMVQGLRRLLGNGLVTSDGAL